MTHFDIEIVAELICPWCYIGKKRLDLAIATFKARHPESTFSLVWKPFYLDPGLYSSASFEKKHYYEKHLGGPASFLKIWDRITEAGRPLGINFSIQGRTGSTKSSHKLVTLAGVAERRKMERGHCHSRQGQTCCCPLRHIDTQSGTNHLQHQAVELLFRGHFENGEDVSSKSFLLRCARDLKLVDEFEAFQGNPEVALLDWLHDSGTDRMVDYEVHRAKWKDIAGVPTFTIQGKYRIGGAQEEGVFLDLFERIMKAEGSTTMGESR